MSTSLFWPASMFMRLYSISVLLIDILYFILYTWVEICLGVYRIFKPTPRKDIVGEVVLIAGVGPGIGHELCLEFASLGAEIVCLDINAKANEFTARKIRALKGKASVYTCDVTNREEVIRTVRAIEKDIGPISILVQCCSLPTHRSYTSDSLKIQDSINIGILSHFWLVESILPKMKLRRRGHILMFTSINWIKNNLALSVSQFAVRGLFESLTENIRMDRLQDHVFVSLVHLYSFIVTKDLSHDFSLRVPNLLGTADADKAAKYIVDAFLRNETEISMPKFILFLGRVMRLLPKQAVLMLREILDTGLDFG